MSPLHPSRRRAEAFDALVRGSGEAAPEVADLLQVVADLRSVPPVEARPEFVSSLRTQLMTAARTELVPLRGEAAADRLTVPARRSGRDRRLAAAVGGLAIVGASTSMAVAAQSALPGDVLYPLKRVIENAHTTVSLGEDQKGQTLLANAAGRLDEVGALTRDSDPDPTTIAATLADFTAQAAQASELLLADYQDSGNTDSVVELRAFAAHSLAALDAMSAQIPDSARSALVGAANTLAGIDAAAHRACPTCDGAGISRFPTWMLTSAAEVERLVGGTGFTGGASVTKVRHPHAHPATDPAAPTPSPVLPTDGGGVLVPGDGSSSPSGQQSGSGDPLTDLGTTLLGGTGTSTSGGSAGTGNGSGGGTTATTDGGGLTDLVDGVGQLLDPNGDGTLGGSTGLQ